MTFECFIVVVSSGRAPDVKGKTASKAMLMRWCKAMLMTRQQQENLQYSLIAVTLLD